MKNLRFILIVLAVVVISSASLNAAEEEIIVLIPGWGGEREQLSFLKENLSDSIVIVIKPAPMMPIHEAADSILFKLKEKGLVQQQITLIGFSFGGLIARELAGRYPELKIKKIIAIGTPNGGYWMVPGFIFSITPSSTPLYVIAGSRTTTEKWYLKTPNDGAVDVKSVFSVPPETLKDSAIFPLSHLELIKSQEVANQIAAWLAE